MVSFAAPRMTCGVKKLFCQSTQTLARWTNRKKAAGGSDEESLLGRLNMLCSNCLWSCGTNEAPPSHTLKQQLVPAAHTTEHNHLLADWPPIIFPWWLSHCESWSQAYKRCTKSCTQLEENSWTLKLLNQNYRQRCVTLGWTLQSSFPSSNGRQMAL